MKQIDEHLGTSSSKELLVIAVKRLVDEFKPDRGFCLALRPRDGHRRIATMPKKSEVVEAWLRKASQDLVANIIELSAGSFKFSTRIA